MYVCDGACEHILEDERRAFIDTDLPQFQERAQRLGFIMKDLLREVS